MKALVLGGAGFIGSHLANRLLEEGYDVTVFDNLSKPGARSNIDWLKGQRRFLFRQGDIRNFKRLLTVFKELHSLEVIFHQAAQTAVTYSVIDPRTDFEVNASGTLNVLEAMRLQAKSAVLIFASTNKVYGAMNEKSIHEKNGRYQFVNDPEGINESQSLDFHSPYGCSKGAADEYVLDYARTYGLKTLAFRQSCVYGTHQFGTEDQGWVAWFAMATILGRGITIYGDGKQTRDILYIDDLSDLYLKAVRKINSRYGQPYNVGGGPSRVISLLECLDRLSHLTGRKPKIRFDGPRVGDQRVYVSDIRQACRTFEWAPQISIDEGLQHVCTWVSKNRTLLEKLLPPATEKKSKAVSSKSHQKRRGLTPIQR